MSPFNCGQLDDALRAMKRGDDALEEVYALIGGRMFALAVGILKNAADAEDIVQECLVKIYLNVSGYKAGTNAYAWVMRIVRNACFSFLRKKKLRAEENIDEFFSLTDKNYSPESMDEAAALESAIAKLPHELKEMIYYRYYLDMTVREIAEEKGCSRAFAERKIILAESELKKIFFEGEKKWRI